jgi:hypothetical protein
MHRHLWLWHVAAAVSLLLILHTESATGAQGHDQESPQERFIRVDAKQKIIRIANGNLRFRLVYDRCCLIDSLWIGTTLLSGANAGGLTGCCIGSTWYSTRQLTDMPVVSASRDSVSIRNIRYGAGRDTIGETWGFAVHRNDIVWTIERTLLKSLMLDDNAFPLLQIGTMSTFDGAFLGNGGGAWFRLFNDSAIAYGVHTDEATLWSMRGRRCLRLISSPGIGRSALALSRVDRSLRCTFSVSPVDLVPRFDEGTHRRRFIRGRTDVWQAVP